ncbi:MAG TPA: hypothetical protein PLP29_05395 [Candidatus Ozemobacteraceae bacterium]|nr:hypothetical protein [Candidatus Ozemobacteraceae bacterium]
MTPKHPLARDPNGSNLAFWAGLILVFTLLYSMRFGRPEQAATPQLLPPVANTSQPIVMTPPPLPPNAPIPRSEERIPVVTPGDKPPVVTPAQFAGTGPSVMRSIPAWWQVVAPLPAVRAILPAPDGQVWVATEDGLARIAAGQVTQMTPRDGGFPARPATSLAHDGAALWIGSYEGLFRTTDGRRFERFTAADGLAHDMVWTLAWDGAILWIGTQNGISFRLPDGRFETVTKRISNGGLADLWIGAVARLGFWALCGNDDGLSIWDTRQPAANPTAWHTIDMFATNLAHNWILSLAVSKAGAVWAATPAGLCRLRTPIEQLFTGTRAEWEVFNRSRSMPTDRVDAVVPVGEDVWAGCPEGLVRIRGGLTRVLTPADGLLASDVTSLALSSGTLWVGTSGGVQALALDAFDR